MRLLETVRVPSNPVKPPGWFGFAPKGVYYGLVVFDKLGPFMYFSNTIQETGHARFLFGQPKLGRKWTVDRVVMNVDELYASTAQILGDTPWPNQLSISTQILLNDIPVSNATSLIYNHAPEKAGGDNPIFGEDMTRQNGPLPVELFSAIEVNSGDLLAAEVSFGIATGQSGVRQFISVMKLALQLMGSNTPV